MEKKKRTTSELTVSAHIIEDVLSMIWLQRYRVMDGLTRTKG